MAQDTVSLYSERPDTCTTSRLSSAAEVTIAGSGKLLSIIRQWVASTTSCGQHKRGEERSRKRVWRSMKWNKEMLSHIRPTTRTTPKKTFLFLLWMNTSNWSIPLNGHGAAGLSCACTTTVWLAVVSSGVNTHQQTWSCLFDLLVCRHHSKNVVNLLPAGQLILSVLLPPTGLGCVHHCYQKLS